MTNRQAIKLTAGERVYRKDAAGCAEEYVVERVERVPARNGVDVAVYAGGRVFMAWEIARCDPPQGWPNTPRPESMPIAELEDLAATVGMVDFEVAALIEIASEAGYIKAGRPGEIRLTEKGCRWWQWRQHDIEQRQ